MDIKTKEVVNPFLALQGKTATDAKVAPTTKARSAYVEMVKQNYTEQYTDLRVWHKLDEEGQLVLKDSTSGKNSMFAICSKTIDHQGARFFVMAQIGLKK